MHAYIRSVRLLDSQDLDGGGLLTHEEAQRLETDLVTQSRYLYPSIILKGY